MRGLHGNVNEEPSDQSDQIWLFPFFIFYFVVFVGESKQVVGLLDIALSMYQADKIVNYSRRVLSDHTAAKKAQ